MSVEQISDEFPLGMRVLAVDDNPTCLMVLQNLLRKCHYHVTTTNQAIQAVQLLRENKNQFDLVISDVDMPDMDGFKLLEIVGLEMDLPVIMLSAYGDTNLVMKGITHGACDYLLKPVRIEELKNIWQHVLRRKKIECKVSDKIDGESGELDTGFGGIGETDQNGKLIRKRKDQNDDKDEELEENGDPSTQKKPRVVWSKEMHQKFVAAVNHLGIDKAVPKRILELMNVEKLTRENVASHLQKYRISLKRHANMALVSGSADPHYLRIGSLNNIGNLPFKIGCTQFSDAPLGSIPSGSVLSRLNSPSGLGMCSLAPASMNHLPIASEMNFQQSVQPGNRDMDILEGMPMPLGIDRVRNNSGVTRFQELNNVNLDSIVYPFSNGMEDRAMCVGGRRNMSIGVRRNDFHENEASPLSSGNPPSLLNSARCNNKWATASQSSLLVNSFYLEHAMPRDLGMNGSVLEVPMASNLHYPSSSVCPQVSDGRTEMRSLTTIVDNIPRAEMNFTPRQGWNDVGPDLVRVSNLTSNSTNAFLPPDCGQRQHDEFENAAVKMTQRKMAGNNAYGEMNTLGDFEFDF